MNLGFRAYSWIQPARRLSISVGAEYVKNVLWLWVVLPVNVAFTAQLISTFVYFAQKDCAAKCGELVKYYYGLQQSNE